MLLSSSVLVISFVLVPPRVNTRIQRVVVTTTLSYHLLLSAIPCESQMLSGARTQQRLVFVVVALHSTVILLVVVAWTFLRVLECCCTALDRLVLLLLFGREHVTVDLVQHFTRVA